MRTIYIGKNYIIGVDIEFVITYTAGLIFGKAHSMGEEKKILLVDDDEDILVAMEASLRELENLVLDRATNGNQAVDKIDKFKPDLVVLDMMLPKKSGFLVMEHIRQRRQREKEESPRVIMITGNPGQRHKVYAQSLGIDEYLKKPFRMDRLIELVQKLIGDE